jgi:hypothetical protein
VENLSYIQDRYKSKECSFSEDSRRVGIQQQDNVTKKSKKIPGGLSATEPR